MTCSGFIMTEEKDPRFNHHKLPETPVNTLLVIVMRNSPILLNLVVPKQVQQSVMDGFAARALDEVLRLTCQHTNTAFAVNVADIAAIHEAQAPEAQPQAPAGRSFRPNR